MIKKCRCGHGGEFHQRAVYSDDCCIDECECNAFNEVIKIQKSIPREISETTMSDTEMMMLRDEVREAIKTKKQWVAFVKYMKSYFKD